jgi:WD40 repeat protein
MAAKLPGLSTGSVNTLAFSPNGDSLANGNGNGNGNGDRTACIFDARTADEIEHGDWGSTLAVSHDGTRLATGSEDGTGGILDAETGDEIARIFDADPKKLFERLLYANECSQAKPWQDDIPPVCLSLTGDRLFQHTRPTAAFHQ